VVDPVRVATYRLVQEALTNVGKHAHAHTVEIRVWLDGDSLTVQVSDDGVGAHTRLQRSNASWGLIGLRERAAQLGGRFSVERNAKGGTTVIMQVPLLHAEESPAQAATGEAPAPPAANPPPTPSAAGASGASAAFIPSTPAKAPSHKPGRS